MKKIPQLPPEKLRAALPAERVPFASSNSIPKNGHKHSAQHRALQALELGLHIQASGYNIYLAGPSDLGRSYMLRDVLLPLAENQKTPPDILYVNNFEDGDSPRLLMLPAGLGIKMKKGIAEMLPKLQQRLNTFLERDAFTQKHGSLASKFQDKRERLFQKMDKLAMVQGFTLAMDDSGGMTLFPLLEGKRLNEQEFESLTSEQRAQYKRKSDSLLQPISGLLRKVAKAEEDFLDKERSLEKEIMEESLKDVFDPMAQKLCTDCESPELKEHLKTLRNDLLESHTMFTQADLQSQGGTTKGQSSSQGQPVSNEGGISNEMYARYGVNILVDNSKTFGAPVIFEDHPTTPNLMGSVEREAEMGALVTDFSLIKGGAVHKANGGYLVLRIDDILRYTSAWEALLRSLRSGISRIEDASDEESSKAKGLTPDPIPLNIKVILVGSEDIYEVLVASDERFSKLFKIKAHLTEHMPRDKTGIRIYMAHIRRIIEEEGLLPFSRGALAKIVDYGSLLLEDQNKLSLKYPLLREIIIEASAFAALARKEEVDAEEMTKAMDARFFRNSLVEDEFMEEYGRHIIKVLTSGEAVGRANGLAVVSFGDFEFGLPHQISCTVGVGNGGIIDLERDAQLGGPIHTKAMMILKTYLVGAFAHNKPLVLTGSLGFEQNYLGIEGDSASGAELAALLSALAQVPICLSLAFTGAVSQSGEIMAVGGVTRKIEGYFEVCKRHGLNKKQGVIIPRDNISHLMLNEKVIDAVTKGMFHIYPVGHIKEALELLTGLPSGTLRKDGTYTPGSLFNKVDQRLKNLTRAAMRYKSF